MTNQEFKDYLQTSTELIFHDNQEFFPTMLMLAKDNVHIIPIAEITDKGSMEIIPKERWLSYLHEVRDVLQPDAIALCAECWTVHGVEGSAVQQQLESGAIESLEHVPGRLEIIQIVLEFKQGGVEIFHWQILRDGDHATLGPIEKSSPSTVEGRLIGFFDNGESNGTDEAGEGE
jgi:hypothetical protein